jgi:hypothetical protein
LVLERMGIPPRQALYVGDRQEIDGLAAERAGMAFFAAGDGHPEPAQSFQRLREMVLGPKTNWISAGVMAASFNRGSFVLGRLREQMAATQERD